METALRAELEGRLDAADQALRRAVEGVSDADANRAPESGRWPIAGQIRHLVRSERLFHWIFRIGRWRSRMPWRRKRPAPSLDELRSERTLDFDYGGRRVNAPFFIRPPRGDQPPIDELLERLRRAREKTKRELTFLCGRDVRAVRLPHPLFGSLDGYQWMAAVATHEHHHVAFIDEARASF